MTKEIITHVYEEFFQRNKANGKADYKESMVCFWNNLIFYTMHRRYISDTEYVDVLTMIYPGKVTNVKWEDIDLSTITRCETFDYVMHTYGGLYLAMLDADE